MKIKIDIRDEQLINWLKTEIGVDNFKYYIRSDEIEFLNEADFLAFRLKFQDPTECGFIYSPNIPEFDYYKYDKKS